MNSHMMLYRVTWSHKESQGVIREEMIMFVVPGHRQAVINTKSISILLPEC